MTCATTGDRASKPVLPHDEPKTSNRIGVPANLLDVVVERNSQGKVGLVFALQEGSDRTPDKCALVTSIEPDSTASGTLASGDRIYYVDGKSVPGLSTAEIIDKIEGDAFSKVKFTITPVDSGEIVLAW